MRKGSCSRAHALTGSVTFGSVTRHMCQPQPSPCGPGGCWGQPVVGAQGPLPGATCLFLERPVLPSALQAPAGRMPTPGGKNVLSTPCQDRNALGVLLLARKHPCSAEPWLHEKPKPHSPLEGTKLNLLSNFTPFSSPGAHVPAAPAPAPQILNPGREELTRACSQQRHGG